MYTTCGCEVILQVFVCANSIGIQIVTCMACDQQWGSSTKLIYKICKIRTTIYKHKFNTRKFLNYMMILLHNGVCWALQYQKNVNLIQKNATKNFLHVFFSITEWVDRMDSGTLRWRKFHSGCGFWKTRNDGIFLVTFRGNFFKIIRNGSKWSKYTYV